MTGKISYQNDLLNSNSSIVCCDLVNPYIIMAFNDSSILIVNFTKDETNLKIKFDTWNNEQVVYVKGIITAKNFYVILV